MKKSRPIRRIEAPTGSLLDAYTEGPSTTQGMSDSEKFKEGYKKKGKGKAKNPPKKVDEALDDAVDEGGEEEAVIEPMDDGVVDSWDQIDVEEMPVPVKVKKEMRKEEKKRKKDMEKAAKAHEAPEASEGGEIGMSPATAVEPVLKGGVTAPEEKVDTEEVTQAVGNLRLTEAQAVSPKGAKNVSPKESNKVSPKGAVELEKGEPKELTAEEKAAVKADREAKKAAKAAQRQAAKLKKVEGGAPEAPVASPAAPGGGAPPPTPATAPPAAPSKAEDGEKKPTTKAERRAKQEAQRAAKAASLAGGEQKPKPESKIRVPDEIKADDKKTEKKLARTLTSQKVPARTPAQRLIPLFSHLHQYEREKSLGLGSLSALNSTIHPAVIQLGLQYAQGSVTGSSERCIGLLTALRSLLSDCLAGLQPGTERSKEIDNLIKPNITFLKQCRPLSISMQNAIRYLKRELTSLPKELSTDEFRSSLLERIDDFININFVLHPAAISETANRKIRDGDVILTFSHSRLVEKILVDAAAQGKRVRVIVAESRAPGLPMQATARELAVTLTQAGVHTTYLLLTALDLVLPEVTLVLLGCEGVMANGCVLATVGTSQVALMAKARNKPVLVCCETYKFTTRVQTDSFVYNELSDPDDLVRLGPEQEAQGGQLGVQGGQGQHISEWRDIPSLSLLNLVYDLTPACLVDSIITEISQIPPTSVPVVLRLHKLDSEEA